MRVLELGTYLIPAYAGMILAEQNARVTKWLAERPDPIEALHRGDELWDWLNHDKTMTTRHAQTIQDEPPTHGWDIVIDNIRADTWARWGINPTIEARRLNVTWVSMRDEFDQRSFDAIAQARAWGDQIGVQPIYLGDTTGGLWLAFKALAAQRGKHHIIHQATCLAKLVEGELVVPRDQPWDQPGTYGYENNLASVDYRGDTITEPLRDDQWRREHLNHDQGRYQI